MEVPSPGECIEEALSESCTPSRLDELSKHSCVTVRWAVAGHPKTRRSTVAYLAKDGTQIVRHAITGRPDLEHDVAATLLADTSEWVRQGLRSRRGAPQKPARCR